ncbi:MAG: DNA primase regulatory subunit PriL [Halococcoides sp.]
MRPLHARYPFLSGAREAVETANLDLLALVESEDPAVDRAVERVRSAVRDRSIGDPTTTRAELLSYPIARVLVSVVDERICTRRYARAEATTARERFVVDLEPGDRLRSGGEQLSVRAVLEEFDLQGRVHPRDGSLAEATSYAIDVTAYLQYAADRRADRWRLPRRRLADGRVRIDREDLFGLLESAVEQRVQAGLPLGVPDSLVEALDDKRAVIETELADLDLTREIDTVVPDLFPPCMQHLLARVQSGDHLEHHSRFAITSFLTGIGMSTDEIVDLYQVNPGFGEEMTRYQTDHIRGETSPTEYSSPSCATMQSYGDCVNKDDLCEEIPHPMAYYERRLDDADDDLEDWREADHEDSS